MNVSLRLCCFLLHALCRLRLVGIRPAGLPADPPKGYGPVRNVFSLQNDAPEAVFADRDLSPVRFRHLPEPLQDPHPEAGFRIAGAPALQSEAQGDRHECDLLHLVPFDPHVRQIGFVNAPVGAQAGRVVPGPPGI